MNVWPKNDEIRKFIVHPSSNISFPEHGPVDWPDDAFTHRRIADGDVLTEEPASKVQAKKQPDIGKV